MANKTLREKLISSIMDLAGDEFETVDSVVEMAKESDEQLVDRLIHIAGYYQGEYNSLDVVNVQPEFISKMDWDELRKQKLSLLASIDYLRQSKIPVIPIDLDGIVHLIDAIQDYAVDELKIEENKVYSDL